MSTTDNTTDVALGANVATALYGVTGAGEKIGIISDSFNNTGGESADIASGALPSNMTLLYDQSSGGSDEGRAMTEIAYSVASGAQYYFASGNGPGGIGGAVSALQAAGCTIIIDDLSSYTAESDFQTGSTIDLAIQTAVSAGVDYFTSAGNNGSDYYQQGFTPISVTIPNIGAVTANNFGSASPYLSVTIPLGVNAGGLFQWAQPFASFGSGSTSAQNSLAIYLLDSNGNIVASATADQVGGDPVNNFSYTNNTNSTSFSIVVVQNGGTVPAGEQFKFIWNDAIGTINSPNAGTGSGSLVGHEQLAGANVVAAVNYANTPEYGVSPATVETFSSSGPGGLLINAQGTMLATPVVLNEPQFAAPDATNVNAAGTNGHFAPFFGTSAAAPAAGATSALMLQANTSLTTPQVTALLEQSTIPATGAGYNGAGLIQARAAVELSAAGGGDRWTSGSGGNWNAATWSTGAAPTTSQPVYIDDNLGVITGPYSVTVNSAGDVAGAIALAAPAGSGATLNIATGGSLAVGGAKTSDIIAGEFLVSDNGTLSVTGGSLAVAGSLNVNNGAVNLSAGGVTASNYAQNAGSIALGGSGTASLTLSDSIGFSETGGVASVLAGATLATSFLTLSAATLTDAGDIADAGALAVGTTGNAGNISLLTGGELFIGGSLDAEAINFVGPALLEFTSTNDTLLNLNLNGIVSGFTNPGDIIDFSGLPYSTLDSYNYAPGANGGPGDLSIFGPSGPSIAQVNFAAAGTYSNASFHLTHDAGNNVEVTAACYCAGTRIQTDAGEMQVEALSAGDLVLTISGQLVAISWIGLRQVDFRRCPDRAGVQPIRIHRGALGNNLPRRDLLVSPEHAIFVDAVLIPARHLVGCPGIVTDMSLDTTIYYHIELPAHDVILAEGLPCESWLDTGNRAMFENADLVSIRRSEHQTASEAWATKAYAPLVTHGPALATVRRRLGGVGLKDVRLDRPGRHEAVVPPGPGQVRLLSPRGRAAGDARTLGAAIDGIFCLGETIDLTDRRLASGFHPTERSWRWTDGAGLLDLGPSELPRSLMIGVSAVSCPPC